jgi:cytochrome P450 family 4
LSIFKILTKGIRISDIAHQRSYNVIQRFDFLFQFTPTFKRQQKLLKILHNFTDSVILERRKKLLEKTINYEHDMDEDNYGQKKKIAFLDVLLQSTDNNGYPLSNFDIREEVDTFMFEVIIIFLINI